MSKKSSRPSPRIYVRISPPLAFEAFNRLVKAIGQTMDDLGIPHETSSEHVVRNEGDIVTLYDPAGAPVATFDLSTIRA